MQLFPAFLLLPKDLQFLLGRLRRFQGGRDVLSDEIEVDFYLLPGVLTAFLVTLMDKNFLDKFIEHGRGHGVKILVLVNHGNEFLG